MRAALMNPLVLAYLGDAIFEAIVREYLIKEVKLCKPNDLQQAAIQFVSATAQQEFIKEALTNDWLSEEEVDMYKRGRNTKTNNRNETVAHTYSTGYEAMIGQLYLEGKVERIKEIFALYQTTVKQ